MELVKDNTAEIVKKHLLLQDSLNKSLKLAIEIGGMLIEEKNELPHGSFGSYIEHEMPFSMRTAQSYMRFYREKDKLDSLGITQLSEAYMALRPPEKEESKKIKDPFRVEVEDETVETMIEDADVEEVTPETAPKIKPSGKVKQLSQYDYWRLLQPMIENMNNTYERMKRLRNGTTPKSLGYMIGNIRDMAIVLESWDPENISICGYCSGKGCEYCIGGKAGHSKESEY